jgi:hypothetical protein
MTRLRICVVLAGLALGTAMPSPAAADLTGTCPDGYQLAPIQALPPEEGADKDRNNNGFVCAKGPQGSNDHFNVKDDQLDDELAL